MCRGWAAWASRSTGSTATCWRADRPLFAFVDTFILLAVLAMARAGWRRGFASAAIDLVGFTAATLLALRFHDVIAVPFRFLLTDGWASLAGGLAIFVPSIVAIAVIGAKIGRVVMQPGLRMTNKLLGVGFGLLWAAIALTFVLLITQVAPVPRGLHDAVRRSPTAGALLSAAAPVTTALEGTARRDGDKLLLWIRQALRTGEPQREKPEPDEPTVAIDPARPDQLSEDRASERRMLELVNQERTSRDLKALRWDDRLARTGRSHSRDMYLRGYFAHRSPDGDRPGERLERDGIDYGTSGENLALSPDVADAHARLMASPGHKRNILDPDFTRLGIGIVVGPDGVMVSQEFCGAC